jgi:hypothetical protein
VRKVIRETRVKRVKWVTMEKRVIREKKVIKV